jgi:hypothetical protein
LATIPNTDYHGSNTTAKCGIFKFVISNARCTREIKSTIVMAKSAFNKKKNLFTNKLDLDLRKKTIGMPPLEPSFL